MSDRPITDPRVQRTRARVIETALDLIRRSGPSAITYSALADASGVGRATIYRHWPTLDDLFADLIQEAQSFNSIDVTGDLRADLQEALKMLTVALSSQEGQIGLVAMLERALWDPEMRRLADLADAHSPVVQVLSRAITDGRLPPSRDPRADAALLVGPLIHRALVSGQNISDHFIEFVADSYLAAAHPT